MFLNALKNNNFLSYFFDLLLAVGFGISVFQTQTFVNNFAFIDLHHFFFGIDWLYRLLFFLLWLTSVFWVNRLMVKYKILDLKGGLPVFLYVLFSFVFWQFSISLDILLSTIFLLLLFEQLMIIYQNQSRLYQSMNVGFLFGIAAFSYFPLLLIFPWVIFALSKYKTLKWRDYVFIVFGTLIPFYLFSCFQFFNDLPNKLFSQQLIAYELPVVIVRLFQSSYLFIFTSILLLLVLADTYVKKRTQTLKNRVFYDVLLLLFAGVVLITFFGANSIVELSFLVFPLTYLGAMYFESYKKKWLFDFIVIIYFVLYYYQ